MSGTGTDPRESRRLRNRGEAAEARPPRDAPTLPAAISRGQGVDAPVKWAARIGARTKRRARGEGWDSSGVRATRERRWAEGAEGAGGRSDTRWEGPAEWRARPAVRVPQGSECDVNAATQLHTAQR